MLQSNHNLPVNNNNKNTKSPTAGISSTSPTIKMKHTVSFIHDNLIQSYNKQYLAYIHKTDVYVINNNNFDRNYTTIDRIEPIKATYHINNTTHNITNIKYIKQAINNTLTDILVILTDHGQIILLSDNGQNIIYNYTIQQNIDNNNSVVSANCITSNNHDTIYVGTSNSSIVTLINQKYSNTYNISNDNNNNKVIYTTSVYNQINNTLVLGGSTGLLYIVDVNDNNNIILKHTVDTNMDSKKDNMIISSCLLQHYILTTSLNGVVTVYDTKSNQLYCTIQAHSKSITALSVNNNNNTFTTTGEDSYVTVWQYNHNYNTFKPIYSNSPFYGLLTGVVYLNDSILCVTCYDSRYLYVVDTQKNT